MGAEWFQTKAVGRDAEEAFDRAVEQANHDYGHCGYTGTIAEKESFEFVTPNPGESWTQCVDRIYKDRGFDDKWGPAGCIKIESNREDGNRLYVFFGWAST